MNKNDSRESNIELLKVIAIFIIVLHHTAISMTNGHPDAEWFYDINSLPNSIEKFVLTLYNYFGYIGNNIFFVCSAWFLLEKKQNKKIKILQMETDVWIISVIYLVIFALTTEAHLSGSAILRSLCPTMFDNYWFVTAYMLFYFIYPGLNLIIKNTSRMSLKYGCLFFGILICIWMPIFQEWSEFKFYFSYPMMWVLVYFCIAYLKTYHIDTLDNRKFGIVTLLIGIIGLIGQIAATYFLGDYLFFVHGSGMRWNMWYNPFEWMIAIGSLSLFRTFHFHNRFINRISSLSLLVYLIHENYLLRDNWRPYIYVYINEVFHNTHVPSLLLFFAFLTFVVSILAAFLYQKTIQKAAYKAVNQSCDAVKRIWLRKNSTPVVEEVRSDELKD